MKTFKHVKYGRTNFIYLDGVEFREMDHIPSSCVEYFTHKGILYVRV